MKTLNDMVAEHVEVLEEIDPFKVYEMVEALEWIKYHHGRLFFIGNGGGAGHASHAAADFRKIGGIESYAWGENVSDLTAWANDTDWNNACEFWLNSNQVTTNDGLFVFSVGGGGEHTSYNLCRTMMYANQEDMHITGIVGQAGFFGTQMDSGIILDTNNTPIVEGLQAVLWHMIVSLVR